MLQQGEVSASIDWLTMTVNQLRRRDIVAALALEHADRLEKDGYEKQLYNSHGYTGFRCGGITYGQRRDDDIVRLSGSEAGIRWRTYGQHADNVSRIDLQATHRLIGPAVMLARRIYDKLENEELVLRMSRQHSIIENSTGGSTLYIGSRTSETFLRLYDKGVEAATDSPGEVWRWEVELKDKEASALHSNLTRHTSSPIVIASHVWRVWNSRGLAPPWHASAETVRPHVERPLSDEARKLLWLRAQVAPTVAWLVQRGKRQEVLDALGGTLCNLPTCKPPS